MRRSFSAASLLALLFVSLIAPGRALASQRVDAALTVVGDAAGLHVLVAQQGRWRTLTTLSEPGTETDRWVGNACVTGSGRRAVIVYAPRDFTNRPSTFQRGGFTAVVDLDTGAVTKLGVRATLAYYSPGCGTGERAVLTQARGGETPNAGRITTRLFPVDAARRTVGRPIELRGQVTSAVPVRGAIAAAEGRRLVRIAPHRPVTTLARATSTPFRLVPDVRGGVVYMQRSGSTGEVRRLAAARAGSASRRLGRGALASVSVTAGTRGRAWITGSSRVVAHLPRGIRALPVPSTAQVSGDGRLAILAPSRSARAASAGRASFSVEEIATGRRRDVSVVPGADPLDSRGAGADPSPLNARRTARTAAAGSPTDPVDADATCSIARNDTRTQVYQPTPRQVEWAVDQAVVGNLRLTRPGNWKGSGLGAWSPQGLFPPRAVSGGGRVNAQIMLGILAQESNLWQASGHAMSGVTGNPLVGNFYGRDVYDDDTSNDWDISFSKADCGYGVSQITDGMRKAGSTRPGEVALTPTQQRAAAVDYATNIAAGLRILQDKWNQTRDAGLIHSDGDPANIENWIFAVWAYNSGFYPNQGNGSPWGVGWANNPANPNYPANRGFFNRLPSDAAHPQDWPYPEKVIGWAAYSIATPDGPGFRPAWWVSEYDRDNAKPPLTAFCAAANDCRPGERFTPNAPEAAGDPAGPCAHRNAAGQYDLKCWWHDRTEFNDCARNRCGFELLRFDTTYPEQPDGTRYPPNCSSVGLPGGALVIDDVPDSVPAVRPGCSPWFSNAGSFALTFGSDAAGRFPSKVDFHQIGAGFGGHFWFAHTRRGGDLAGKMKVTGKWTLDRTLNQWARVLVHMPDHGAHTQQARYVIDLGNGVRKERFAQQQTLANRWVSLGVMKFAGRPSITLSSETYDGRGEDDVSWDAVAIQQLAAKPRDFVVALGDSYSSGEGGSEPASGDDYYKESDNNGEFGDDQGRNACHRSPHTWSRLGVLAGEVRTLGTRADTLDPTLDYQLHACSGAKTHNLLPYYSASGTPPRNAFGLQGGGQYGELSQLDQGYLDEHTTLVTLSIGGNDARFGEVVKECIYAGGIFLCPKAKLSGESEHLDVTVPRNIQGPVRDSILQTLREIRKRAPNARIVLMGYPKLLSHYGRCVPGIERAEGEWMNEMSGTLATAMDGVATQAAAEGIRVTFSNPTDEFEGQGICGDPGRIHSIVVDTTAGDKPQFLGLLPPSQQSFHPTIAGYQLYAASLNETLRRMGL